MNSRHSGFNEEGQGTANSDANCPGEIHEGNKVEWKTIELDEIEVQEQIGGGSVGIVHRGKYKGESVALKTLFDSRGDDILKQEYLDELLVLSQLDHPNIVRLLGACMTPPHLFYVMELCERSLFDVLHKCQQAISTRKRVGMALDVSKSMAYLHSRHPPIIHRDLKSLNLLVGGEDSCVKLCDFGLVRSATTTAGTPCYMAPELLRDFSFNKSVDVYAFGILLWEIFAREVPFRGYETADVREVVINGGRPQVPSRAECPMEIRRLMCQCWSGRPAERPNFDEIENVLEGLLGSTPETTHLNDMESAMGDCLDDLLSK